MEDTKKLIEKYKRELMELSKAAPRPAESSQETHGAHGTQGVHESSVSSEATETFPSSETPETADMPAASETAETTAAPETFPAPETTAETPKAPKIIGYVTEESGEFPAVFDRFITEAVENNDIETIRTPPSDTYDEMDDEPMDNAPTTAPPTAPSTEQTADEMPEVPDTAPTTGSDFDAMNDMAQGTGESISDFPVSEYATVEEFEAGNRGGGSLEFRVFTAREAMPIENASIIVSARINGDDREMFSARTNSSGETDVKTLPAPLKSLSQSSENTVQPFSLYDASVEKEGYIRVVLRDIPIFDGIRSIQSVAMIPELQSENNTEEITEVNDAK